MFYINRHETKLLFEDNGFKVFLLKPYRLIDTTGSHSFRVKDQQVKRFFVPYDNFYDPITYEIRPFKDGTINMNVSYEWVNSTFKKKEYIDYEFYKI